MLNFFISFRHLMLIPSLGALVGALLMFWHGAAKILRAVAAIAQDDGKIVIGSIMSGTDAFLFGIVLLIFAYAIAFGFVFELSPEDRAKLPAWMSVNGLVELKATLVSVIIVYLIVDFTTDWPDMPDGAPWSTLIKPISIFIIAGAFYLLSATHQPPDTDEQEEH
ncbi:MAG: YqhA family protein [Hyphomicrobiaceae bacterium]